MTHGEKLLAILKDGKSHSTSELHRRAGNMIIHSRIAGLRKQGHTITCEHVKGKKGALAYRYTWVDAPPQVLTVEEPTVVVDAAPRRPEERYRLYAVRNGGAPELVATCGTPEAVGVALCTLGPEDAWRDACVGVLDCMGQEDKPGKWLILPWTAKP